MAFNLAPGLMENLTQVSPLSAELFLEKLCILKYSKLIIFNEIDGFAKHQ